MKELRNSYLTIKDFNENKEKYINSANIESDDDDIENI